MIKIGAIEITTRPDGKHNIWKYMYFLGGDNIPRWVLVGVVKHIRG